MNGHRNPWVITTVTCVDCDARFTPSKTDFSVSGSDDGVCAVLAWIPLMCPKCRNIRPAPESS